MYTRYNWIEIAYICIYSMCTSAELWQVYLNNYASFEEL